MEIDIAYGKATRCIQFPDGADVDIVSMKNAAVVNGRERVLQALLSPIGSNPLSEIVKPRDDVAIVISDITRPFPHRLIIPALLRSLRGVTDSHIRFFVATGTHRTTTEKELKAMVGSDIVERFEFVQNDASAVNRHSYVGTTKRGTCVNIHRDFLKCRVKILTGFIEPHFFAGFSGGGKAVMPGLASLDTIINNHGPNMIESPMARWCTTHGNPIWEDIQESAALADPTFLLNITMNGKGICGIYAGDFEKAYERGCLAAAGIAMSPVSRRYDIVITCNAGYPLDLNMYQAVKGMSAASLITKGGGSIIVAAECSDGIPDSSMYRELLEATDSPGSLLQKIRSGVFRCRDIWQAQIHADICRRFDVYFYSDKLTDDDITKAFMIPCRSIGATVESLLIKYGKSAAVCVLPDGPLTVPYLHR